MEKPCRSRIGEKTMAIANGRPRVNKSSKKILVVDDDEAIRSLCSEVLTVAGYQVVSACDGMDALDMLRDSAYDLIISDVDMPRLDGLSFYSYALKEYPYIKDKFIFVTGNGSDELQSAMKKIGALSLRKPFRISELIDSVDSLMAKTFKVINGGYNARKIGKRREDRVSWIARCDMFDNSVGYTSFIAAETENLSRSGIKIRFAGEPLVASKRVSLSIKLDLLSFNIERSGKVVWSKTVEDNISEAGILFTEPVPASSVINLMPVKHC